MQEIACNPYFLKVKAYSNVPKVADQDNQALWSNAVIEIHRLHTEILSHARISLDKAILIGEILAQVKDTLKHGQWYGWLKEFAPFSRQTGDNYLWCFENRIGLKTLNVSVLAEAYQFKQLGNGQDVDQGPQQLHEPNFHSQFVKIKQTGIGLFNHWIQRRPLKQWQTEELFDTLASVEPWLEVSKAIKEELSTRTDVPRSY